MSNKGLTSGLASSKSRAKAQFPPNISTHSFDPTTRDYFNFSIGDIWINRGTISAPLQRIWILVNQANHIATWVLIINGGGGPVVGLQPQINGVNNGAVVNPLLGIININNTDGNIIPSNGGTNHLNLDFAQSIVVALNITATAGNITTAGNGAISTHNSSIFAGSTSVVPGVFSSLATLRNRGAGIPVQLGDTIGGVVFLGETGAGYTTGASIAAVVDGAGTIAANRLPTALEFSTHPNAVLVPPPDATTRMVISSAGNVQIDPADSGVSLKVVGTIAAGGDEGGTVGFISMTNVSTPVAVGVNTLAGVAGGATNQGYLKFYINGVAVYVPYFTNP